MLMQNLYSILLGFETQGSVTNPLCRNPTARSTGNLTLGNLRKEDLPWHSQDLMASREVGVGRNKSRHFLEGGSLSLHLKLYQGAGYSLDVHIS